MGYSWRGGVLSSVCFIEKDKIYIKKDELKKKTAYKESNPPMSLTILLVFIKIFFYQHAILALESSGSLALFAILYYKFSHKE